MNIVFVSIKEQQFSPVNNQWEKKVHYRTHNRNCTKRRACRVKQDKQDRRSQRTRHLVNSALMELLREKRYDAITIQDLLDRANIGRSTFYTHYFDKEDVLVSLSEQMLELFRHQISQRKTGQSIIPSLEIFQHASENYQFFQAMLRGHAEELLWETVRVLLSRTIEEALASACEGKGSPSIPLSVVAQYVAGAFGSLLKWWLEADMPYSPEEMEHIFQQLALPGVWATIEGTNSGTGASSQ
jgi:AcrR family transcriptional regulator